jgi:hypothetical protein
MVHQIEDSIRFDCMEDYYKDEKIQRLSGEEWLSQEIQKTLRNISYHKKEWEEEKARVAGRNQWLKELRKSLEEAK